MNNRFNRISGNPIKDIEYIEKIKKDDKIKKQEDQIQQKLVLRSSLFSSRGLVRLA